MLKGIELSLWYLAGCFAQALLLLRFKLTPRNKGLLALPALFFIFLLLPLDGPGPYSAARHLFGYTLLYSIVFSLLFFDALLPWLNGQTVLLYTLIFWYSLLASGPPAQAWQKAAAAACLLPSLGALAYCFTDRLWNWFGRYLLYTWFVFMALFLAFRQYSQHRVDAVFAGTLGGLSGRIELFLSGMTFLFLGMAGLLLFSLLPFDIALVRRQGRTRLDAGYLRDLRKLDKRFHAGPVPRATAAWTLGLGASVLGANLAFQFLPVPVMVQLAMLGLPLAIVRLSPRSTHA